MQHSYLSPINTKAQDTELSNCNPGAFEIGFQHDNSLSFDNLESGHFVEPLRVNKNILNVPPSFKAAKMSSMPFKSPIKTSNPYCPYQDAEEYQNCENHSHKSNSNRKQKNFNST